MPSGESPWRQRFGPALRVPVSEGGKMSLSPEQRVLRSSIAAHTRWSRHDPVSETLPARRGFYKRFEDEVDPHRVLSQPERERRAHAAMRAHMLKLALASSKARSGGATP